MLTSLTTNIHRGMLNVSFPFYRCCGLNSKNFAIHTEGMGACTKPTHRCICMALFDGSRLGHSCIRLW